MLNVTVGGSPQDTIQRFHQLYYSLGHNDQGTWRRTHWMGAAAQKFPHDLWIYQELIFKLRPDLILETGTYSGGSALFLSHMCDILGAGEVVTVDIYPQPDRPAHPRLTYLTGSSTAPEIVNDIYRRAAGKRHVLVILDSDHSCSHVLDEMRAYHALVPPGGYLIVEDTNLNGHPVLPDYGPGPMEAIALFMRENNDFEIDRDCEKLLLTANPNGFLRKRPAAGVAASVP